MSQTPRPKGRPPCIRVGAHDPRYTVTDRPESASVLPPASLDIVDLDDTVVLVTASGSVAARHGADLWSTIEAALEIAIGRRVVADLSRVTAFDGDTVAALLDVARACLRRRLDLCAIIPPGSPLAEQAQVRDLGWHLQIHPSLADAIGSSPESAGPGPTSEARDAPGTG